MARSRRLKAFELDPTDIGLILVGDAAPVPLPSGIRVERYATEWSRNSAIVIVSHETFDEIEEGGVIPIQPILLKSLNLNPSKSD